MKRLLRATSIAFPLAGIIGGIGINCSNATGVLPDGGSTGSGSSGAGSGSSSGNNSSSGSGSSSGDMGGSTSSSSGVSASGSSSGVSGSTSSSSGVSASSSGSSGVGGNSSSGSGAGSSSSSSGAGSSSSSGAGNPDAGAPTVDSIFGIQNSFKESVKDSFILFPCYSQNAQDCITAVGACPNQNTSLPMEQQGITSHEYFQLGGTVGKMYSMKLQVNGIAEAKYYQNGVRFAGNTDPANPNDPLGVDTMYTGGDPVNIENYNIYKITVRPPPAPGAMPSTVTTEVQHYYLNSFPKTNVLYEHHETFPIHFIHDIPVPGGGVIEYSTADRNCHAVDNCGQGYHGTVCTAGAAGNTPRTLPPPDQALAMPASYMGQSTTSLNTVSQATQPWHSQLFHITVVSVTAL